MAYFNYHAAAKRLIKEGKLRSYCFCSQYKDMKDVLLLYFDDLRHPVMPIRSHRIEEYLPLLKGQAVEKGDAVKESAPYPPFEE